jgi:hypothetical protein
MVLSIDIVLITYVTSLSGVLVFLIWLSSSFPIAYFPYISYGARKVIIPTLIIPLINKLN